MGLKSVAVLNFSNIITIFFPPPQKRRVTNIMSTTKTEAARPKPAEAKKVHIADTQMTIHNWYKHVNWLNVFLIVGIPMYGTVQAFWVPLQLKTAIWSIFYYFCSGLGITGGSSLHLE